MRRNESQPYVLPLLCLTGAVVFWGTGYAATKTALGSFPPLTVTWLRMVVATLVFAPFWRRVPRPQYRRGDWKLLVLVGTLMPCLYYVFEGYALTFTTSSQAGVVAALVPLMVALIAWLVLGERLTASTMTAILVALAGVTVLSLGGVESGRATNPVAGALLEFMAVTCAAGWMLSVKHLGSRYHPWLLTGGQVAVGVVAFLPAVLLSDLAAWRVVDPAAWASVLYLGVFVSLGAFGLYNTALESMSATRASLAINLVPVIAVLTGWLVLGETLTTLQLAGCVAVLAAVVLGETVRMRELGI